MNINNLTELKQLLSDYNIDTKNWRIELGNKTIEDLFLEIQEGESQLKIIEQKLVRLLQVSSIEVKFKLGDRYFQLFEDKQIFLSGIERKRDLNTITEKLKDSETPLECAYRGLEEEIGLKLDKNLTFINETNQEKISPSYPHLITLYKFYNYTITLGEKELIKIRFSEYREEEQILSLFSLKQI